MKTIALDYDGTYTADPMLWDTFIAQAHLRDWRVFIVTARRDTEENVAEVKVPGCSVVFTCCEAKEWFMREKRGINVDIWIDDAPSMIVHGL